METERCAAFKKREDSEEEEEEEEEEASTPFLDHFKSFNLTEALVTFSDLVDLMLTFGIREVFRD